MYTSGGAVVDFIGTWVEACFSVMADECTDITTVEVFCRWEEKGTPN